MSLALRLATLCLAFGAVIGASGCITINLPSGRVEPLVETTVDGSGDAKILLLEIDGVIRDAPEVSQLFGTVTEGMVSRVRDELDAAREDDNVRAVVLRINSPGGTVTGSDILYREILRFKQEEEVPVVAQMMGMATSGGYYVAMAADRVRAERTTVTGSIGVIFSGLNLTGLMKKVGVEDQTVTSGDFKDTGSMLRPMRKDERVQLQSVIDDLYGRFLEVVAAGREDLTEEQIAALADGRIYSASQALEAGLIDEIGSVDGAVAIARSLAGVPNAKVVTYHRPSEHTSNFYTRPAERTRELPSLWPDGMALRGPAFLYLWAPAVGLQ
ncbi:MAG: signal peptide peptidase SppA [Myxococcota bacterium]